MPNHENIVRDLRLGLLTIEELTEDERQAIFGSNPHPDSVSRLLTVETAEQTAREA